MSPSDHDDAALARIRQEIDRIDDRIADLIAARMATVDKVKSAKKACGEAGPIMRPEREAEILDRLLDRLKGVMPPLAVANIWRQLISSATQAQGRFGVHLAGPGSDIAALAAAHFGADTQITEHGAPPAALEAVRAAKGDVAVLPASTGNTSDDDLPWWFALDEADAARLHVIGALPVLVDASSDITRPRALVVGGFAPEIARDRVSVMVVEAEAGTLDKHITRSANGLCLLDRTTGMPGQDMEAALVTMIAPGRDGAAIECAMREAGFERARLIGGYRAPGLLPRAE